MKIASGVWRGLEVSLVDEADVGLPEYPPEDATPTADQISKHVESQNGLRFAIKLTRPTAFQYDITATIHVDGRRLRSRNLRKADPEQERKIDSYHEQGPLGPVRKKLMFGNPAVQDDRQGPLSALIDDLGKITIKFKAGRVVDTGEKRVHVAPSPGLNGKARKLFTSLMTGEDSGIAKARRVTLLEVEPGVPRLTVNFIYRQRATLELLGVAPRLIDNTMLSTLCTCQSDKRKKVKDEDDLKDVKVEVKRESKRQKTGTRASSPIYVLTDDDDKPELIDLT